MHYWMLDVDMDYEQAFSDGQGRSWFELKAFMVTHLMTAVAPTPGWEGNIAQTSNPAPPYSSTNYMGICGMINVFVANFANLPGTLDPDSCPVLPAKLHLSLASRRAWRFGRNAERDALHFANVEKRCLGNLAQTCQDVSGHKVFRTAQDCTATPAGGNFVQMCQRSTGQCCTPGLGQSGNCQ